jgi:hypothetical protein
LRHCQHRQTAHPKCKINSTRNQFSWPISFISVNSLHTQRAMYNTSAKTLLVKGFANGVFILFIAKRQFRLSPKYHP